MNSFNRQRGWYKDTLNKKYQVYVVVWRID
jgi:hypothetical protein